MAPDERMHIQYAKAFENHSLGYALLHPCPIERLHPGVCGYFDKEGDWRTIVDIPQIKDEKDQPLGDLKFSSIDSIPPLPAPNFVRWEPKCSYDVTINKGHADTSAGYIYITCTIS
jgi:hypothetical protein